MPVYQDQLAPARPMMSSAQTPQPEYGVQTALKQLHEASNESYRLSSELKQAIGISEPAQQGPEKQPSQPELARIILMAVEILEAANANQRRVLQHLAS